MKIVFRGEYSDLADVSGLTLNNSVLDEANILQELNNYQESITVRMEQNLKMNIVETMAGICEQVGDEEIHPLTYNSNNHNSNEVNNTHNLSSNDSTIF